MVEARRSFCLLYAVQEIETMVLALIHLFLLWPRATNRQLRLLLKLYHGLFCRGCSGPLWSALSYSSTDDQGEDVGEDVQRSSATAILGAGPLPAPLFARFDMIVSG